MDEIAPDQVYFRDLGLSSLPTIDGEELATVVGGEATRAEKAIMNGVDSAISYFDPSWAKSDCAGRFGYIGWGYGSSTGIASTLLMATGGGKLKKAAGVALGLATSFYGARLQKNYVDNCKANQEGGG